MSVLSSPYFHDEAQAFAKLESILWADGIVCPHCGTVGTAYALNGKTTRMGLKKCKDCRKQFTVKVGTVFEDSHVPLHKWFQAAYLLSSSKKGISAHQLHRTLEVTYKTAWFMAHRLREAMRVVHIEPMGGDNKVVEADETYIGGKEKNKHANKRTPHSQGGANKEPVVSLVERAGKVRSFHVANVTAKTLKPILEAQMHAATYVMTDESRVYPAALKGFAGHGTVNHGINEYLRGGFWHTNTVEGYFSILKRGINGVYHHVGEQHLKRYLAEFDFRYNERKVTDSKRTETMLAGVTGKRLTYRRADA